MTGNCMVAIPHGAALDMNLSNLKSDSYSIVGAEISEKKNPSHDYNIADELQPFVCLKTTVFF